MRNCLAQEGNHQSIQRINYRAICADKAFVPRSVGASPSSTDTACNGMGVTGCPPSCILAPGGCARSSARAAAAARASITVCCAPAAERLEDPICAIVCLNCNAAFEANLGAARIPAHHVTHRILDMTYQRLRPQSNNMIWISRVLSGGRDDYSSRATPHAEQSSNIRFGNLPGEHVAVASKHFMRPKKTTTSATPSQVSPFGR